MLLCDEYNHPIISKGPVRESVLYITGDYVDFDNPFNQSRFSYRTVSFKYILICSCGERYRIREWAYKYYPRDTKGITREDLISLFERH